MFSRATPGQATQEVPILYLYPEARWEGNAGRQQLLSAALGKQVALVFLETAPGTRSPFDVRRPRVERVSPQVSVVHDCAGLRGNRWWRRLGAAAARMD